MGRHGGKKESENQKEEKRSNTERTNTKKMKSKKKQGREEGRGRPECIPLGSYFKALMDVFEENFYKMHLFTEIGNYSDWAEAHNCEDTSHAL